jgi:hypothetical protein
MHDVTDKGKQICTNGSACREEIMADFKQSRKLTSENFTSFPGGRGSEKLYVSEMGFIVIGDEMIDVRGIHDVISSRQTEALAFMLRYLEISNSDTVIDIDRRTKDLYERIAKEGVDFLYSSYFTTCNRFLDLPRRQDLLAVITRMRNLRWS